MTGVSGFVGSALAAAFLRDDNIKIISLANDDPEGSKALRAISSAAKGFNFRIFPENRFQYININNFNDKKEIEHSIENIDFHEIWHVAAHMSYDLDQLVHSIQFNAVISNYLLNCTANKIERFYYISTTGVTGPGDTADNPGCEIPENLLSEFEALNPYTISKCLAEYMLTHSATQKSVGLTILRLGSVVGHSNTGWNNGSKYGYYSYLSALKRFANRETTFYLNLDPEKRFPIIFIDHLVNVCCKLQQKKRNNKLEIFHLVNQNLPTVREHFSTFQEVSNGKLKIDYGEGKEGFNKVFNDINKDNNRFLNTKHIYSAKNLINLLGENNIPPAVTRENLYNLINGYIQG
jgi:nucleoside-diphosphate-sugar epimerase